MDVLPACLHYLNTDSSRPYSVPGTALGTKDPAVEKEKKRKFSVLVKLAF